MPIKIQVGSIDELCSRLADPSIIDGFYIDANIQEENPKQEGFPMHFRYSPLVIVRSQFITYSLSHTERFSEESPDQEQVRLSVRVKSLRLALGIVARLSDLKPTIKINDLPFEQAEQQAELYEKELDRVRESHKGLRWL